MRYPTTAGSASLIALMIGVLLSVFLYVHFFLTPRPIVNPELQAVQPTNASGTIPTTEYGRARADVEAAERTRALLNSQNVETNAALGY